MNDLLGTVIEAHGGLERWNQLDSVSARLVQGGAMWGIKGQQGVLEDAFVRASLHQERESHHPFGARTGAARSRPSAWPSRPPAVKSSRHWTSRAPRSLVTLLRRHGQLQLAYFVGTAMWTYLTQPFTFALPGFKTRSLSRGTRMARDGGGCT